jgi:hypothetical protein
MKLPIYLDYNATTPVAADVADAIEPYLRDLLHRLLAESVPGLTLKVTRSIGSLTLSTFRFRARGAVGLSVGMPTAEDEVRHAASALSGAFRNAGRAGDPWRKAF